MTVNRRNSIWRGRLLAYAPIVFWIGLIFFLSSQGSFTETSRFIGPILRFFLPGAPPETLALYHGLIRKVAHVGVYAVLSFLAVRALTLRAPQAKWPRAALLSLLLVLIVGSIDETNQSLLTSRTGSAWDVLIDLFGGLLGFLTARLFYIRGFFPPRSGNSG